ncbi:hypothetical protein Vadar_005465 [Vaccinium darrowii]|uniref:Uncharacterized protein n=1 Tax=Vaccinium darrowii TaxID=229202 RepID=A0ACB7Z3C9_9ERIC|nr:hypothetical protein Vadar_005465 [Vaccinium darrowii]
MGRNLKNAVIALLAPLPSLLFYLYFLGHCTEHGCDISSSSNSSSSSFLSLVWNWCYQHPILLASLLFLLNVDLLFWLIGLLQSSNWLIDVYWTVITVLLMHYYATHPLAKFNPWRSKAVMLMTWVWAMRLSHNYFRREKWQWGAREDWRFIDMRRQYGKNWWWVSFFSIYVAQQVFLIGVCMPFYVIHSVDKPWNFWDTVATLVCITGIVIAYCADTQLYNFVASNEKLKQLGKPVEPCLDKGLWRYSRHPNYFGEQLWWWGLAIFGWNLGCGWTVVGALINSMCLAYVTVLVERRMLEKDYRAEAYRVYQETTSVWVPWFKSSPKGRKEKDT